MPQDFLFNEWVDPRFYHGRITGFTPRVETHNLLPLAAVSLLSNAGIVNQIIQDGYTALQSHRLNGVSLFLGELLSYQWRCGRNGFSASAAVVQIIVYSLGTFWRCERNILA